MTAPPPYGHPPTPGSDQYYTTIGNLSAPSPHSMVCMYMYVHVCMYVYIYVRVYASIYMYACICVSIYICMYVSIYLCNTYFLPIAIHGPS